MQRGNFLSVISNLKLRKAMVFARVGHFDTGIAAFVLVMVTIAVIRHMTTKNLGRKGFISAFSSIMVHHPETSGQKL